MTWMLGVCSVLLLLLLLLLLRLLVVLVWAMPLAVGLQKRCWRGKLVRGDGGIVKA
jgi:hypothetical protein